MPEPVEQIQHASPDEPESEQAKQESKPEQQRVEPQMAGMPGWLRRMSPRTRTLLGLAIICVLVVGAFFAPPQGMSNNVSGDTPPSAPTAPTVTNLVEQVTINRTLQYRGIQITVLDASLASRFSDDRSRAGKYTVRVMVRTQNPGQTIVGIEYNNIVRLVTANGTTIEPKRLSIKPLEQPNQTQTGFIDFPLDEQVPLSSLALRFDNNTVVPLKQE